MECLVIQTQQPINSNFTHTRTQHSKLDINAMDDAGMTPLMWAAYNNNPLVTEFLLSKGADCEEKDKDGMTAMHWSVYVVCVCVCVCVHVRVNLLK